MDSIGGVETKKSKKSNYEGPNKICYVPTFIIGRNLSFQPTNEAVCTSVLSKRWIYLLTFITKLEFEDGDTFCRKITIRKASFYNIMDKVLLRLRVQLSKISLFFLQRVITITVLIRRYLTL